MDVAISRYSKRFGMVHIDYATQKRTLKKSAKMFTEVAKTNTLKLPAKVWKASNFVMIEEGTGRATTKDAPPGQKEAES